MDLAIRGAIVISDGAYARDVLIRDGRVAALVEPGASSADEEIDATGLFAMPGIVDAHVHFNDPGRAEWEGWASGSRAAAAGGVTTVIDMPLNSLPPVLDGASFDSKRVAGERASVVDFALWGGLVGTLGTPSTIDGGGITAPSLAFYNLAGKWDIENIGVTPDIEVENTPAETMKGRDPQLERAVQEALKMLQQNPVKREPRPAPIDRVSK